MFVWRHLTRSSRWLRGCFILAALLLSGCGPQGLASQLLPGANKVTPTAAATPSPTPNDYGYEIVLSPYCLAVEWQTIQTEESQGDLMAWAPDDDRLARIEPGKTGNWSVGNLVITTGRKQEERLSLNIDALIFGDLAWSPDGQMLAFVALRNSDSLYTIMTVDFSGDRARIKDRLSNETARTDSWGSNKAVIQWIDAQHLQVASSCGPDCDQEIDIDISTGDVQVQESGQRKSLAAYWTVANRRAVINPDIFPPMIEDPSWSPDGNMFAYQDDESRLWVLSLPERNQTQIKYPFGSVQEIKWSHDNRKMAIRTDDRIFLYTMDCE